MTDQRIKDRLRSLGLELPSPPKPAGNYVPSMICGPWLYLSAQFPIENGQARFTGRIGTELTEEQGYEAAQLAALNVLAQIHAALGGFERLDRLARVEGHVASRRRRCTWVIWIVPPSSNCPIQSPWKCPGLRISP